MGDERPGTRDRILRAAYRLFYRQGFSRVSVDAIAARAEVTKRTIYYHFKSKDDIASDVLDAQHRHLMAQFAKWIGESTASPERKLESLFGNLLEWSAGSEWLGSGYSRIAMELADMPGHPARRASSEHKRAVEAWLREQFQTGPGSDADDLARQLMILIEGSMNLALIHGEPGYIRAAACAAKRLAWVSISKHG